MTYQLILVRHGQSEWNLQNLFTGWKDPDLTSLGVEEAKKAGQKLKNVGLHIDAVFTSLLQRAQKTADHILSELQENNIIKHKNQALNERDYGDLSGLNKDEAREKWGEEQIHIWRRSYDIAPPHGESLRDTLARALPYYLHHIQPLVLQQKTVLIAAHGNSLRALIMALEGLTPEEIIKIELKTGVPIVYKLNADSTLADKLILD